MAAFKFKFYRRSVFEEIFTVEADSEQEALDLVRDECPSADGDPEWVEWYDDDFHIDGDPEPLDPLHRMLKDYEEKQNEGTV